MDKRITTLLFLLICNMGLCQIYEEIDSLNAYSYEIRSSNRDSSRILAEKALYGSKQVNYKKGLMLSQLNLGIHYCNINKLDSASTYLIEAHDNLSKSEDQFHLAISFWYKAKFSQKLGNFKKAFMFLNEAERLFRIQKNDVYLIYILAEHGTYQEMQGNYTKALEYFLETYNIRIRRNEQHLMLRELDNIASVYLRMGMYENALEYAKLALELAKKNPDRPEDIGIQLITIGDVFIEKGDVDSALYYFNRSYEASIPLKQKTLISVALTSIASAYSKLGNHSQSIIYLLKAKPISDIIHLLDIYLQLGQSYCKLSNTDSSLFYFGKAQALALQRGSKSHLKQAYNMLMNHYEEVRNFDSAFYYSKKFKAMSDSISNQNKNERFNDLRVQLETLEKENEIQVLKFESYESKVRNTTMITVAILIIMLIVILFIGFNYRQKRKQYRLERKKKELEVELEKSMKKLSNHTLSMIHRNNMFEEIEDELKGMKSRSNGLEDKGIQKIKVILNRYGSVEDDWLNFQNLFREIHNEFFSYFEKRHPDLSDYEIRLCALIKLNLTNKEIASILSIGYNSVKTARYRLKKKLGIDDSDSLTSYIAGIGNRNVKYWGKVETEDVEYTD